MALNLNIIKNKIVIRELELEDAEKLEALIDNVEFHLENETFWLPISDESRKHFFDKSWTRFLGMFDGTELIAAIGLFLNENEYEESRKELHIEKESVAELGRAMVNPLYRRQGFISSLGDELMEYAESLNIKNIVATAHPQNIGSVTMLENLGFKKKGFAIKQEKYERNIYLRVM